MKTKKSKIDLDKKLIELGAREIDHGVWITEKFEIYSDSEFKNRYEFQSKAELCRTLAKGFIPMIAKQAMVLGKKFIRNGDMYIKSESRDSK